MTVEKRKSSLFFSLTRTIAALMLLACLGNTTAWATGDAGDHEHPYAVAQPASPLDQFFAWLFGK